MIEILAVDIVENFFRSSTALWTEEKLLSYGIFPTFPHYQQRLLLRLLFYKYIIAIKIKGGLCINEDYL